MFEGFPLICTVLLWPVGKEKENQVPSCKHSPNFKLQQLQHARKGCCRPWSLQGIVRPLATLYLDCLSPQPQPSSLDVSNWRLEFREKIETSNLASPARAVGKSGNQLFVSIGLNLAGSEVPNLPPKQWTYTRINLSQHHVGLSAFPFWKPRVRHLP